MTRENKTIGILISRRLFNKLSILFEYEICVCIGLQKMYILSVETSI